MGKPAAQGFFARLRARWFAPPAPLTANARARQLVEAIARDLGLEVSRKASVEDTIARIRLALTRVAEHD